MTSPSVSTRRWHRTWVAPAAAAIVTLIWVLPPSSASAHSELLESTPASGAELTRAPSEVELVFGESVQQQGGSIVVSVRDTTVSQDSTFTTSDNRASVQLAPNGQPGTYSVAFRVVSADGHIVSDRFEFTVLGETSATPTATRAGTPTVDESPIAGTTGPTEDTEDSGTGVVWVLGLGAIGLVLVAAVISVAVRGRRGRSD